MHLNINLVRSTTLSSQKVQNKYSLHIQDKAIPGVSQFSVSILCGSRVAKPPHPTPYYLQVRRYEYLKSQDICSSVSILHFNFITLEDD